MINWTEIKLNKEVSIIEQELRKIIIMIEIRRIKLFRHLMRHNTLIIIYKYYGIKDK